MRTQIWTKFVPAARITELGMAENFWAMGETGPCGRCSEIHYFRGEHVPCEEERQGRKCLGIDCNCDRFVEVWNNVFMEFDRQSDGVLTPLPAPSIDTGMGLERVTAVIQGKLANYDTDLFTPLLSAIGERAGRAYGATLDGPGDVSMRVVADHLRAMTFLIADGVVPSNEWRGYVLRKIMRRAMRHGKKLGFNEPLLHTFVDVLVAEMGEAYPELRSGRDNIVRVVKSEEERFDAVLTAGLPKLEEVLDRASSSNKTVSGEDAFRLYDSLGVPLDFMEDLAGQRGLAIDRQDFERAMEGQRERARAGSAFKGGAKALTLTMDSGLESELEASGDKFEGYESTSVRGATVLALFDESGVSVDALAAEARGYVALNRTPFYLEAGGQVSDSGRITGADGSQAVVERVTRPASRTAAAAPRPRRNRSVPPRDRSSPPRSRMQRATRHAAITPRRTCCTRHCRQVFGTHVKQAGSLVAPDRLRFDFVHIAPVSRDEIDRIERIVNDQIVRNTPVQTEVKSTEEAIAHGAMALFGEKYGDRVRVVSVPGFSMELCGGTHVRATGDIGAFVITEESGVAAGVRRIEALTGSGAIAWLQQQRQSLGSAAHRIAHDTGAECRGRAAAAGRRQASGARSRAAQDEGGARRWPPATAGGTASGDDGDVQQVAGVKLVARRVDGLEKGALRGLSDSLRDRLGSGVVVLASDVEGKVALVVSVSKDLTPRVQAGRLVKELAPIVGGGGGGRPDFAEAGGKDATKIDALLAAAPAVLQAALG